MGTGIARGLDLKYDRARLLIIAKLPVLFGFQDRILSTRESLLPGYLAMSTSQDFAQLVGRHVRAENDWGYTVIVDSDVRKIYSGWEKYLPEEVKARMMI